MTFFFPVFRLLPPYRINETLRSKINLTMLLKTSIGLVQIVNLPNIQVSGFPKLTSPSLHFFFKTQHWALICHSIGAKIYQDLKSIERYRTCLDYLFIINQNSSACFYSKQNSIVTLHPVQKLKDNLDKYPRTFDSCFLSYMIDTYIKTL